MNLTALLLSLPLPDSTVKWYITASAKGNKSEDETKEGEAAPRSSDNEAQAQANAATGGTKTLPKANDSLSDANDKSLEKTGDKDGNNGTGSSSVGVPAAIGVNWVISENRAVISDNISVTAGGALEVKAESETDLTTKVTGAALSFESDTGVGAAVGLNVGMVTNEAIIGSDIVVDAGNISIQAVTPEEKTNDFTVWALAIGGGKDNGVAGSAGINVMAMDTDAGTGTGTTLKSTGNIDIDAENDLSYQNIAGGGGVGKKAGVGVAVAANIITMNTDAYIGDGTHADASEIISIDSDSSITPVNLEIPGMVNLGFGVSSIAAGGGVSTSSEGKAAVGGSAVIDVHVQNTHAYIGEGTQINTDNTIIPGTDQSVVINASSLTRILNGAGGLAVAFGGTGGGIGLDVGVIVKDTSAYIESGSTVTADKSVTVTADSEEVLHLLQYAAGVSKENGIAGSLAVFGLQQIHGQQ